MPCEIVIVGDFFGDSEILHSQAFTANAGSELYRMLCSAGFHLPPISSEHISARKMKAAWQKTIINTTCVFKAQTEDNKIESFLAKKGTLNPDGTSVDIDTTLPPVVPGMYLRSAYRHHLDSLHSELAELKPNLIVAAGQTACWALLQTTKLGGIRGTIHLTPWGKVLPTYHPKAVVKNWELRPVMVMDLLKAGREMQTPKFLRKKREIWVEPSITDLWTWWEKHGQHSTLLSIDIETERFTQISEVGIASDSTHAIHIPFIVERTKSYWPTVKKEVQAWQFIRHVANSPIEKLGQNFMYDLQYFWVKAGFPIHNFTQDTMLLHHALFPGMQKGLGFLASCYTDELSWKSLRHEGNKDNE